MFVTSKQLIGLAVRTQSGRIIGKIKEIQINIENGQIDTYVASGIGLAEKLLAEDLIIDKSQVIEITAKAIIVDNNLEKSKDLASALI